MAVFGGGWGNLGSEGFGGWGIGFWGGDKQPTVSDVGFLFSPSQTGTSINHRSVITADYSYDDTEGALEVDSLNIGSLSGESATSSVSDPFPNADIGPENGTQIRWFIGTNRLSQFDNIATIGPLPSRITALSPSTLSTVISDVVGQTLRYFVKVSDGIQFSEFGSSTVLTLTGNTPSASNHNVDGIADNQFSPGSRFTKNSQTSAITGLDPDDSYRSGVAGVGEETVFNQNTPGFFWTFTDPDNNSPFVGIGEDGSNSVDGQTHWELRVGSSSSGLGTNGFSGNLWNPGVQSGSEGFARYGYKSSGSSYAQDLSAATLVRDGSTVYYWQVRVSDGDINSFGDPVFGSWSSGNFKLNVMPSVSSLKVEGISGFTIVDTQTPEFSWAFTDPDGIPQDQIEIRVSNSATDVGTDDFVGDLLATGAKSQASTAYTFDGTQPFSHIPIYWQVRVRDGSNFSDWSDSSFQISIKPEATDLRVNGIPDPERLVPKAVEKVNDKFKPVFEWVFSDLDKNDDGSGGFISDSQEDFVITVATDSGFAGIIWTLDSSSSTSVQGNQTFVEFDIDGAATSDITNSDRGSTYYWKVVVTDDSGVGSYDVSDEFEGTFQYNQIPTVSTASITPNPSFPKSVLFSSYDFTDLDGDPEVISSSVVHLRWFKKGPDDEDFDVQESLDNSKFVPLASELASPNRPRLSQNDTWKYEITPFDGYEFGSKITSSEATIGNHAPLAFNLQITPSEPKTHDLLFAEYGFFDEDGDLESDSIIKWFKNDEEVESLRGQKVVYPENLTPDSEWYFSVTPYDGFSFGAEIFSGTVTIEAVVPVINSLMVDRRINPKNIINLNPTFSWTYYDLSGVGQKGFRLKIGTQKGQSDVFDSGFIESEETTYSYDGPPLNLGEDFFVTLTLSNDQGISDPFKAEFSTFGSIWGERVDNQIGWTIVARMKFIDKTAISEESSDTVESPEIETTETPEPSLPSSAPPPPPSPIPEGAAPSDPFHPVFPEELGGDPSHHPIL
jgi:hypothetical protein